MAKKATKEPKNRTSVTELDVPVRFRSFAYGGGRTCRLGLTIAAEHLSEKLAKHYLGGAQLTIQMRADPNTNGDVPGQGKLVDDVDTITAVADAKGYSYGDAHFSAGLTFPYADVKADDLLALAGKAGRISATRTGDAATSKKGKPAEAEEEGETD